MNNKDMIGEPVNIEKIRGLEHAKSISRFLTDLKVKIAVYSTALLTLIGILIYAFVYLNLGISIPMILPFVVAGLFLFSMVTSGLIRLYILTKESNKFSIKESAIFFSKRLKKIKLIDFVIYLSLCYTLALGFAFGYLTNFDGIKLFFNPGEMKILLVVFISILLIIPWVIKNSFNQRYRDLFSYLDEVINYLKEAS